MGSGGGLITYLVESFALALAIVIGWKAKGPRLAERACGNRSRAWFSVNLYLP